MSSAIPTPAWYCQDCVEIITVPRGVGVGSRYIIAKGEGGNVEVVGALRRSLGNAGGWGEGWANEGVDFDFDLAVLEETDNDFNKEDRKVRFKFGYELYEFVVPDPIKSPTDVSRYH